MDKASIQLRLDRAKQRLDLYYDAETKILAGAQSYAIGTRNLTRANLAEIRKEIDALENQVLEWQNALTVGTRNRTFRVLYRDL